MGPRLALILLPLLPDRWGYTCALPPPWWDTETIVTQKQWQLLPEGKHSLPRQYGNFIFSYLFTRSHKNFIKLFLRIWFTAARKFKQPNCLREQKKMAQPQHYPIHRVEVNMTEPLVCFTRWSEAASKRKSCRPSLIWNDGTGTPDEQKPSLSSLLSSPPSPVLEISLWPHTLGMSSNTELQSQCFSGFHSEAVSSCFRSLSFCDHRH